MFFDLCKAPSICEETRGEKKKVRLSTLGMIYNGLKIHIPLLTIGRCKELHHASVKQGILTLSRNNKLLQSG